MDAAGNPSSVHLSDDALYEHDWHCNAQLTESFFSFRTHSPQCESANNEEVDEEIHSHSTARKTKPLLFVPNIGQKY